MTCRSGRKSTFPSWPGRTRRRRASSTPSSPGTRLTRSRRLPTARLVPARASPRSSRPIPAIVPDDLQIGQKIYIPFLAGTDTPTPGQQYTIQPGDTLNKIAAAAYGAASTGQGVTAIEQANPAIVPDDLQIGQKIYIPVLA